MSRVIDGESLVLFRGYEGARLSSSTETTGAEAWESKVAWKWELMSEWDSRRVKGGLDMVVVVVVIVGGPRPLLRALWGRLSNKSRLLCWRQYIDVISKFPAAKEGRGRGVCARERSVPINFRSRNEQMDPRDGQRQPSPGDTEIQKWVNCQVPAAV